MQLRGHLLQEAFLETPPISVCGKHLKAGGTTDHVDAMLMMEDAGVWGSSLNNAPQVSGIF